MDVQVTMMERNDESVDCEYDVSPVWSECLQVFDEYDSESKFYGRHEQLLMDSMWSSGIRDEGQKFKGGPIEF